MNDRPTFGQRNDPMNLSESSAALGNVIAKATSNLSKMKEISLNDDEEFLTRVRHCLEKGEKAMSFVQRTGLGPAQVRTMSKSEISEFVEVAAQNAVEGITTTSFERPPTPTRIVVETW